MRPGLEVAFPRDYGHRGEWGIPGTVAVGSRSLSSSGQTLLTWPPLLVSFRTFQGKLLAGPGRCIGYARSGDSIMSRVRTSLSLVLSSPDIYVAALTFNVHIYQTLFEFHSLRSLVRRGISLEGDIFPLVR